jgi:hypothetical protein
MKFIWTFIQSIFFYMHNRKQDEEESDASWEESEEDSDSEGSNWSGDEVTPSRSARKSRTPAKKNQTPKAKSAGTPLVGTSSFRIQFINIISLETFQ